MRKIWNAICFLMLMTVYFTYITMGCMFVFVIRLIVPGRKYQEALARTMIVAWLHLTRSILSGYFPGKIFIRYDPVVLKKNRNVVVCNHQTEYDWLFIGSVLHQLHRFEDICISLKMSLQNIPLLGYGMRFFQFIFLNRRVSRDRELIAMGTDKLKKKGKYDLLLFPEGTYIDREAHVKSQEWSDTADVRVDGKRFNPEEVIVPRTTGFKIVRECMRDDMEGVIDMTMIGNPHFRYPNDKFSYWDVIVNKSRKLNFMFILDYIPNDDNMDDDEFMIKLFDRKEHRISKCKEMMDGGVVSSMSDFKNIADSLIEPGVEYEDAVIDLTTHWSPLFYTMFVLGSILMVHFIMRLFCK